jgi:hypothetical protein
VTELGVFGPAFAAPDDLGVRLKQANDFVVSWYRLSL